LSEFDNLPPVNPTPNVADPKLRRSRWLRIALWSAGVLLGLVVIVVIGVATLLRSQRFHDYVLSTARRSASESLGVRVELQNYEVHFSGISPTADLYGLVVHGAAPFSDPPLLQVEHARIGVRVVSLLSKKWYLSEFTINHAVAQIYADANGNNNLPKPKQHSSSNGVQPLFDLAIRHVVLERGEIYYNDRQSALDADMHDVTLNAALNTRRNVYAGQIAYSDGHLKSDGYEPIPHALSAEFEMTPRHLDIRKAELRSGASAIGFTATVDDFNNPRVKAEYHGKVDTAELRRLLHNAQVPIGVLQLDGSVLYAAKPNQPALNGATLFGSLRSERLEFLEPVGQSAAVKSGGHSQGVQAQTMRTEVRGIRAVYRLENGDAELRSLTASLLGGTVEARATVRNLSGGPTGEQVGAVHVNLNGISLASLRQLAGPSAAAQDVTLAGTLQGTSDASWKASLSSLQAHADLTMDAAAGSTQSAGSVPIAGELHASFRNSDQQITLAHSYFRTPQTTLTLDGTLDGSLNGRRGHSQMKLALAAQDLHELETIAGIFSKPAQPLGLFGGASFTGTLSGAASSPRLTGELSGANVRLRGSGWRLVRAHLDASPSMAEIQGGELEAEPAKGVPPGKVTFSGRAELHNWSPAQDSAFEVTLNVLHLDAGPLARLAGLTTPFSGTLNAAVQAHGTELNPLGQGRVELVHASIGGEQLRSIEVKFTGDGDAVHTHLNIAMPAGAATGELTYHPKQRGYEVQVDAHDFKLDQLQAVKGRNLSIAGALNLTAKGRGTLDDPQLTASVEIPQLRAEKQTIDHLALMVNVAQNVANLSLDTRAVNANIHGHATIQLTGDYVADAALDTQPIPLQPLLATYAPDEAANITGETELHATLRGPLKHPERIEAHVTIPELNLHYEQSMELAASGPIHVDYVNGVLNLARSGLKGTDTDLQFQGSLPLLDRTQPVSLLLVGSLNLRLAQLFDPDVTSSGEVRFNINSYGARSDPNVEGSVQIVDASFVLADAPLGFSNGHGVLALTRDRLNITNLEGTMGGGKVTVRGGVVYHPSLQLDLAISAQGVRMLYPEGVRQGLSANLTLTGTPEQAAMRGQVNVDQLSFAPDFDLSTLAAFGNGVAEPPSRGFANNLRLNVAVRSTQSVNLVSRTLSVSGAANLRLSGTAAEPVLLGRASITGGDLIFQGNRYILQGGVIDFVNPSQTEPNVNLSMNTTIQQYNIGMRIEGTPDRLRTTYSSDPALPPADIINLIAFGKTQEASNAANTTANQTAEQSIASAVSGQVTSRVQNIAGLSHLSVDPTLGNTQGQNAGAIITVQKRVTSKIFVTFQTDVTSTQQEVIQVEYQATPRISYSGTRDQNGGFAFETRITREW
jgi:translocation and assembly module TamB